MDELEQVKLIIEECRKEHELLYDENFRADELEYACELLSHVSGRKAVNAAAAVEFVSLGVTYHYLVDKLDARNLILGDYFYAKALKQISNNKDPEQVRILAQAVREISAAGGREHRKILETAVSLLKKRLNSLE